MSYVLLPDREVRDLVLGRMKGAGVHATFHYVPLHSSPEGRRVSDRQVGCPVTEEISGRLLRLPFFTELTDLDIDRVVDVFLGALSVSG